MAEGNQNSRPVEHPRVIDDPTIRETYANKLISAQFDGGAIVVTMGTTRITPNRVDERPDIAGIKPAVHVSTRVACSPNAALELINALNGLLGAAQAAALRAAAAGVGQTAPPVGKAN